MSATNERIGVGRRTAYALAVFPLDIVHRATIRAMLPTGFRRTVGVSRHQSAMWNHGTTGGKNNVSKKYIEVLREYEQAGHIDRGAEFLRVKQRGALLDVALRNLGDRAFTRAEFIRIDQAIEAVRDQIDEAEYEDRAIAYIEQRRRELQAIYDLMKSEVGGQHWSGRGSVRLVPTSAGGRP